MPEKVRKDTSNIFIPQTLMAGFMVWVLSGTPYPFASNPIDWFDGAIWIVGGLVCMQWLINTLYALARVADFRAKYSATGHKGTARWATYKDIASEINKRQEGPFWGRSVE